MAHEETRTIAAQSPPRAIDAHAHWHPAAYLDAMAALGRTLQPEPLNVDLDRRLSWMDTHRIKVHCLTLLTPALTWAPADVAARLARVVNDAAMAAHDRHPTRFIAGVAMPIQNAARALEELNRVAAHPAFRGVHFPNSLDGVDYLVSPGFAPVLARCEALRLPLLLHPLGEPLGAERLAGPAGLTNSIGYPFEHATTAAKLITTGTLDRYPGLDVVLPHGGGAFPYLAGRIEHGLARREQVSPKPFTEYIRRFHYDAITYHPRALRFLIDLVGSDRVVIGSDNFAVMDIDNPLALVDSLSLPAPDHDRIVFGNAARLFRLA